MISVENLYNVTLTVVWGEQIFLECKLLNSWSKDMKYSQTNADYP